MLSGLTKMPQVLLFMLIIPPFLYFTDDGESAILIALVCTVLHGFAHTKARWTTAFVTAALAYIIVDSSAPWYMSFTAGPAVLFSMAALGMVVEEVMHGNKDAHAVRKLVYKTVVTGTAIMAVVYAYALVSLMEDDKTLTPYITTTRNCTETSPVPGYIMSDSSFSTGCPTRVWEYIRNDILLLVQAHVLYTLTTALRHDMENRPGGGTGAMVVVECIAWTMASIIQFNYLDSCYRIRAGTAICTVIATLIHLLRDSGGWIHTDQLVEPRGTSFFHGTLTAKLKL